MKLNDIRDEIECYQAEMKLNIIRDEIEYYQKEIKIFYEYYEIVHLRCEP